MDTGAKQLKLSLGLHRFGHLVDEVIVFIWLDLLSRGASRVAFLGRVLGARGFALDLSSILGNECLRVEPIAVIEDTSVILVLQYDAAQVLVAQLLGTYIACQQLCAAIVHKLQVRAQSLASSTLIVQVHLFTLIQSKIILVRVLLRVDSSFLPGSLLES